MLVLTLPLAQACFVYSEDLLESDVVELGGDEGNDPRGLQKLKSAPHKSLLQAQASGATDLRASSKKHGSRDEPADAGAAVSP
jgi:hypothetical protein